MKLKCKYSNILRYWITFYFHELYALIIENKKKIYIFKCFTLHVMNLEYMKVSLSTLSRYSNVLRCTCVYIYVYISAVKRLIMINRIQNKSFCLHNKCVCTVHIYYVYKDTHIQHIF